jgi:hypothetical protein
VLCAASAGAGADGALAERAGPPRSALLLLTPAGESELARVGGLSLGIMSAAQGPYSRAQFLLDVTQGARLARSAYPTVAVAPLLATPQGAGATVTGWRTALRRARDAAGVLQPGLLASEIAGGAAYVGVGGEPPTDAALAADRTGRISSFSLGSAATLPARAVAELASRRFVVADLPGGAEGLQALRQLSEVRPAGELVIVVQRTPPTPGVPLSWVGLAGFGSGGTGELTSRTTQQRGLISSNDLAPTVLAHLRSRPIPPAMSGSPIAIDGHLQTGALRSLMARLAVIEGRRLPALAVLLAAWMLLVALAAAARRWRLGALRAGAVGLLWAPVVALAPAALQPSAGVEYAIVALGCLGAGALTDLLLPWPRAALAPAAAAMLALTVDALAGTQLLMRSLLGPNPIGGARFYGIGNELKSGLAVLLLAAVAGALHRARRGRGAATAMAATGVLLGIVEGAARIGAGVGGAILVSAGFVTACALLLASELTRRRALIALATPLAALLALAAIDLATARGGGHFSGSILHARSAGEVRDLLVRRYTAAWDQLVDPPMLLATVLAACAAVLGLARRDRLLAPVGCDPGFSAAFAGGLVAGVVGALVEDSGPLLLVEAVFTMACVAVYLAARPTPAGRGREADTDPRARLDRAAVAAGAVQHDLML